jgi:alpha-beta hydrolase superfamily lysophospholipase
VAPRGSAEFAAAVPGALLRAQVYPDLFHEIFHEPEPDREIVYQHLLAGLREHVLRQR